MDNEIIWEKWRDPFLGYDENDIDPDHSNDRAVINAINSGFDHHEEDDEEDDHSGAITQGNGVRVIATPMGLIPYNEFTASGKIFNFWTGHTNFKITEEIFEIMEDTLGVETLDIFTPYRFRISIGKAFDATEVKQKLNDNVYRHLNERN